MQLVVVLREAHMESLETAAQGGFLESYDHVMMSRHERVVENDPVAQHGFLGEEREHRVFDIRCLENRYVGDTVNPHVVGEPCFVDAQCASHLTRR